MSDLKRSLVTVTVSSTEKSNERANRFLSGIYFSSGFKRYLVGLISLLDGLLWQSNTQSLLLLRGALLAQVWCVLHGSTHHAGHAHRLLIVVEICVMSIRARSRSTCPLDRQDQFIKLIGAVLSSEDGFAEVARIEKLLFLLVHVKANRFRDGV